MNTFAERHPGWYNALLVFLFLLSMTAGGVVVSVAGLVPIAQVLIGEGLCAVIALIFLTVQGWWRETGLAAAPARGAWPAYGVLALLPLMELLRGWHLTDAGQIGVLAVSAAFVGFSEEIYFRGLMLRALRPKGLAWAVWGTAVLFGVSHSLNVLAGRDPLATLLQVGYAFAFGFTFAVVALHTRSIWPIMIVHALNDFFVWTAEGGFGASAAMDTTLALMLAATILIFGAYGAYLYPKLLKAERNAHKAAA